MDEWFKTVVELGVLVGGVVWVIAKISTQGAVLAKAIENLNETLKGLTKWVGKIDGKVDSQGERIAKVETKVEEKKK